MCEGAPRKWPSLTSVSRERADQGQVGGGKSETGQAARPGKGSQALPEQQVEAGDSANLHFIGLVCSQQSLLLREPKGRLVVREGGVCVCRLPEPSVFTALVPDRKAGRWPGVGVKGEWWWLQSQLVWGPGSVLHSRR